jgi:hypothetical protein
LGLTCDGKIDTAMYNLYNASELYYTNNFFYSSYPFPKAWIEVFTEDKDKLATINEVGYEPVINLRRILSPKHTRRRVHLRASSMPEEIMSPSSCIPGSRRASVSKGRYKLLLPNKNKMKKTLMTKLRGPSTLSRRILRSTDIRSNIMGKRMKRSLNSLDISSDITNYLDKHRISFDISQGSNTKRHSITSNSLNKV